jgi:hypothetical protein
VFCVVLAAAFVAFPLGQPRKGRALVVLGLVAAVWDWGWPVGYERTVAGPARRWGWRHKARNFWAKLALDGLLFARLVDRFWQNLRRAVGYKVQYFAAVELQRRLAPHLHAAVRSAIPRATIKAVAKATYTAIWWRPIGDVVYENDYLPGWHEDLGGYLDPDTGVPLPTWDEALDELDELGDDAQPMHVLTLGSQVDIKGLLGGTPDSDRAVRYLCKYLAESIADTYTRPHDQQHDDAGEVDPDVLAYERHIDRLSREVRRLLCSPACNNWIRFSIQPKDAGPGLIPGQCPSKAHDREHLSLGGRVLVSWQWSGKTLTQHRAYRAAVVRQVLQRLASTPRRGPDGHRRPRHRRAAPLRVGRRPVSERD